MISVDPKALMSALRNARLCVAPQSSRTTYTALYGVRIKVNPGDKSLSLSSTDLRHSIEVLVPYVGDGPAIDLVIPNPGILLGIAMNANQNIGLTADGLCLAVTVGKSKSKIVCESGADLPVRPLSAAVVDAMLTPEDLVTLASSAFAAERGYRNVSVLANTLIEINDGITTLTATNQVHAALSQVATATNGNCKTAVIPSFAWDIVQAFASETDKVAMAFDEGRVTFAGIRSDWAVVWYSIQTVNDMYPAVKSIKPILDSDAQIIVDTKLLKWKYFAGLKLFADEWIAIDICDDVVWIKTGGPAGAANVFVDGQTAGAGSIKVGASQLVKAMEKIGGARTTIAIGDGRLKMQSGGLFWTIPALS